MRINFVLIVIVLFFCVSCNQPVDAGFGDYTIQPEKKEGLIYISANGRAISNNSDLAFDENTESYILTINNKSNSEVSFIIGVNSECYSVDNNEFTIVKTNPREVSEIIIKYQNVSGGQDDAILTIESNYSIFDKMTIYLKYISLNDQFNGYYRTIVDLSVDEIRYELNRIINDGFIRYDYDQCWNILKYADEDPDNTDNVLLLYTGWSIPKTKSGTDTDGWNREHVWAKSHGDFGTDTGPGTDAHNLRACDVTVNSARNNRDFNDGGSLYIDSSPYSGYSSDTGCRTATYSWEPRDADKGDVARIIFYMAIAYDNNGGYDFVDLEINEIVGNDTAPFIGILSVLKQWHSDDPVSDYEKRRNDRIFEYQNNRNPFIDKPDLVELIW